MSQQTGGGPMGGPEPSEEELRAQLEEELKRVRVEDVVVQTVVSLLNLGARRAGLAGAGPEELDPEQVRMAVDAVAALLPLAERGRPAEELRPLRDALSQVQMAYARVAGASPGAGPGPPGPGDAAPGPGASPDPEPAPGAPGGPGGPQPGGPDPGGPSPGQTGAGPAQRSGRLWIPGQ